MLKYCFVLDSDGKQLSPTLEVKAWYMIRKRKAALVSKYPMTIQLKRPIPENKICKDEVRCGIDDGSKHVGIALVQKCKTYNKVLFKGIIEHRNDVSKKMELRRGFRKNRRKNKRYRPARFNNRGSSKRKGRIPPSILQKKQAIIRVIKQLRKWISFTKIYLEDVAIDIRALVEGFKPYNWMYQKPNRLDENLRKAVILRDHNKCMLCNKTEGSKEVHHIKPRRSNGSNTLKNLITLCPKCHEKITGIEEQYMGILYKITDMQNKNLNLNNAMYVMQGKTWLRAELSKLGDLHLTTGGDTANKRIDWDIEKSHSNDAVCITELKPTSVDVFDWEIKPIRRQSKATIPEYRGFKHKDLIKYSPKNKTPIIGYVTALFPKINALNFQSPLKLHTKVRINSCVLLWRFTKIFWLGSSVYI